MIQRSSASRLMQGSVQALWRSLALNLFLFFFGTITGLFDLADDDVLSARDAPLSVGAVIIITAAVLLVVTFCAWVIMRTSRRPGMLFGRFALLVAGSVLALLIKLSHVPVGARITLALMVAATTWAVWGWMRPAVKRRRGRGGSGSTNSETTAQD